MNRTMCLSAAALTVALGVGMKAQSTSSSSTTQSTRENVTVTGCLQGDGTMAGLSAAGAGASTGAHFVLANAKTASGATGTSSTATTGSTSSKSSAAGTSYALDGDSAELLKHVGHEIEVTGRLESASASASSGTGTTGSTIPAPATGSSITSSSSTQKLTVQSVKMIAGSCSAT